MRVISGGNFEVAGSLPGPRVEPKTTRKDYPMRKLILASAAILTLGLAVPAVQAQERTNLAPAAGATTGATLGFIFGGPVGAIIGGFSGAVVGSAVSDASVSFVGTHPVEQVYISNHLKVGAKVDGDVKLYAIDGDPDHVYFYANNRAWIVDKASGKIVASPGFVISEKAVAYVKAHPTTSVTISGDVAPGFKLKSGTEINAVPDADGYGYIYVNDRPALIDTSTDTVVWIE